MSTDELLAALEIAPEAVSVDLGTEEAATVPAGPPPSPTALELDDWSLRRGAESLAGDVLGPIFVGSNAALSTPETEFAAADCLAAAFEPSPQLAERCADEPRGRFFRQLLETEEFQALHKETQLDPVASELAAGHFAKGFLALVDQQQQQQANQQPQEGPQTPEQQARHEMRQNIAALAAAAQALQGATQEIDDLRDAQRSLGGDGAGDGSRIPAAELKARFERIKNSDQLRRIMQLAGRYRRLAQARQRQKTRHGRDDVVGVELGDDLGRLCPSELAALADEDLELDAMRRYLERGLMQRDYRGIESKGKGPIVVVVDESGSMDGEKIATAKAFALAMAWIARHQSRWICLVGFSGGTTGNYLAMPPGQWNQSTLIDWLEHFYSGGTICDVPLIELPSKWDELVTPRGETDVVIITDGLVDVPNRIAENFNGWKLAQEAKAYTIIIGESQAGDLSKVSDRYWLVQDLGLENDAIQEMMSL